MKLPAAACLLLVVLSAASAGAARPTGVRLNHAPARRAEALPAPEQHSYLYDATLDYIMGGDPIEQDVAAIAAASCARVGPERCAANRAFVQQLQQHCAAVFGQDYQWALYSPVTFPCSPDFFACFGTLQPADAAATAASCCAGRFQHCSPCIAGACDPNYPGGWHGQVLSDGSYGYCDALFFGACCTTARCG